MIKIEVSQTLNWLYTLGKLFQGKFSIGESMAQTQIEKKT